MNANVRGGNAESEPFLATGQQHRDVDVERGEQDHVANIDHDRFGNEGAGQHPSPDLGSSTPFSRSARSRQFDQDSMSETRTGFSATVRRWIPLSFSSSAWSRLVRGNDHGKRYRNGLSNKTSTSRIPKPIRFVRSIFIYFLIFLGTVQFVSLMYGVAASFFPDRVGRPPQNRQNEDDISHWPTDFTGDILPVKCHSHNDYWRKVPVFSAIDAGCVGIEADVWLYDDDLFVGHSLSSLTPERTFTSLYIDPLLNTLNKQNPTSRFQPVRNTPRNGIFDTDHEQSLVLLVDFKTNGDSLWPVVQKQLERLRENNYLTYFNGSALIPGPITIVATGNAPFHQVIANSTYRDMFFDAPLAELAKLANPASSGSSVSPPSSTSRVSVAYDPTEEQAYLSSINSAGDAPAESNELGTTAADHKDQGQGYSGARVPPNPQIYTTYNSYYASTSLKAALHGTPFPYLTTGQRALLTQQIEGAHRQGLQVRYWEVPAWPVSWRHYLWRNLIYLGIDYLNVDDLADATKGEWLSSGSLGRLIWGSGGW